MEFGTKKKDAPESSYTGNYLRSFKGGETLARFIDEPDEWIVFREHFMPDGKSFPCLEAIGRKDICPGCLSEIEKVRKSSRKYATNVKLVKADQVLPFKIPITLSDRLAVRAERNGGTLTNRDYVILKSGSGLDTEYDVDQEDKYPVDLDELRKKAYNVRTILAESFAEVWGPVEEFIEKADANEPPPASLGVAATREATQTDDPPFSLPATQSESAGMPDDDSVELTEAQIRAMSKEELRELCDKGGLPWDDEDTRSELADRMLSAFGG